MFSSSRLEHSSSHDSLISFKSVFKWHIIITPFLTRQQSILHPPTHSLALITFECIIHIYGEFYPRNMLLQNLEKTLSKYSFQEWRLSRKTTEVSVAFSEKVSNLTKVTPVLTSVKLESSSKYCGSATSRLPPELLTSLREVQSLDGCQRCFSLRLSKVTWPWFFSSLCSAFCAVDFMLPF